MSERQNVMQYFEKYREETAARVQSGIEQHRKGQGYITLLDQTGAPVTEVKVRLVQKDHAFRFGANLFMLDEFEKEEKNIIYRKIFPEFFNMATLPF